ncbi:MAG: hypothetical protein HY807_09590 [Nitrospirae bacterium]|nr:hypothetical protein [Nitrospirota bacterium]
MKTVKYEIRLKGLATPDGTISAKALLEFMGSLTDCAEKGLRLAVEGSSVKTGRTPAWLERAVDFTISGIKKGSTILSMDAPQLGEVIDDELRQQDFWITPPASEDTAITLFAKSLNDTTKENLESDYYDAGVLNSLLSFRRFMKTGVSSVEIVAKSRPSDRITLTSSALEKVERLKVKTPEPQAVIISGQLDAIQHSRRRFLLLLSDQTIQGRIDDKHLTAENLREYWGKEVTIKGIVHFKPSGKIQLLEAHIIKHKERGEEIFEEMPQAYTNAELFGDVLQRPGGKDWLHKVWGQWPGDESIEEILQELKN